MQLQIWSQQKLFHDQICHPVCFTGGYDFFCSCMTLGIFARTQNYLYLNQFLPSFAVPKTKVSKHALEQQMWDRPLFRHAQGHLSHDFDHEEVERGKEGREVGEGVACVYN